MPGVPDVYQGSEFWEQSLVTTRTTAGQVDFDLRRRLLAAAGDPVARPSVPDDDGRTKLHVVRHVPSGCAATGPDLFTGYDPVVADRARGAARARLRPRAARSPW